MRKQLQALWLRKSGTIPMPPELLHSLAHGMTTEQVHDSVPNMACTLQCLLRHFSIGIVRAMLFCCLKVCHASL